MINLLFQIERGGTMTHARPIISRPLSSAIEVNFHNVVDSPIDRILQKISKMELPDREHFEIYMRHKWRINHKPSPLLGSFHAVSSFLSFYASIGKSQLQDIVSEMYKGVRSLILAFYF